METLPLDFDLLFDFDWFGVFDRLGDLVFDFERYDFLCDLDLLDLALLTDFAFDCLIDYL